MRLCDLTLAQLTGHGLRGYPLDFIRVAVVTPLQAESNRRPVLHGEPIVRSTPLIAFRFVLSNHPVAAGTASGGEACTSTTAQVLWANTLEMPCRTRSHEKVPSVALPGGRAWI